MKQVTKAGLRVLNRLQRRAVVDSPLRRFPRQYEQLSQFEMGRIIGMMDAGGVGTSGSRKYHLYEKQAQDAINRPVIEKTTTSDDSRFNLSSDDNRARVWTSRGERLNPTFALQLHTSPTADVMAGQVDRSECAVRNCWEQRTREGTQARKTGSGVTRKTTRREYRRIVWQALVDPTVTRSTIRADVGIAIAPQTISRHLAEENLKSKPLFRALPLTPEHRQLRLQWCQDRSMWNVTDWQKVVFSDEFRFVLRIDDNRVRVRSILIVKRGTLTGQRYVDHILRPHVGPFLNGLPGTICQQDNARPHTARFAQDFLRHFQTFPWPACSLDLYPVEHVWDQLKWQMPSCHSVHDLELVVLDFSSYLPQDNIRTATVGSDVVKSGRPIFDDFFQHLWPYIGNNKANVVFQIVKRLWLIRIDQ
ncbi:transposable element Tcb1 transposase [Trichonephila clavipes]|nr:transposable element Tcb1 transposase [Trichonephila clavipes]